MKQTTRPAWASLMTWNQMPWALRWQPGRIARCTICSELLTGGIDTFGPHDQPLCLRHHLDVQASEHREGDGNYASTLLRLRGLYLQSTGQMPVYSAPNLPGGWMTDTACIERELKIPDSAWIDRGMTVPTCPECGSDVLFAEVEDWETETGIPLSGSISVSCVAGFDHVFNDGFVKHYYRQSDWQATRTKIERLLITVARERFHDDIDRASGTHRSPAYDYDGQLSLMSLIGGTV